MADRVGQQLGRYRLLSLLGKGGFAEVYLGRHVDTGMQVAIKVLHAVLTGADVDRFRAEAEIIARLAHPHIVRLLEFDADQGTPFLVMEYAPNLSLRERHPRGTPLPLDLVAHYARQVANALQYAHDQKLIHRDIKPENLLIGPDGRILLSDFGIATVAKSSTSQSTQDAMGTVTYMAPEQIQGKPRPASDQYALGVVVYEWLTGEPPFEGSFTEIATQHLFTPPQPPHEKNPAIPQAVEQVILTALAKDPHQRFASVGAFANALEQARQGIAPLYFASTQVTPSGPFRVSTGSLPTVPVAASGGLPTVPATPSGGLPPASGPIATPNITAPPPAKRRWSASLIVTVLLAVLLIGVAGTAGAAYVIGRSQSGSFSFGPTDTPEPTFTPTDTATPTRTPRPTNTPRPTATAAPDQTLPYFASVPGPGCDQGGGAWSINRNYAVTSCSSSGLLVKDLTGDTDASVYFQWPGHPFSQDYTIEVDITNLIGSTSFLCAGISTHNTSQGNYGLLICRDGSWQINRYSSSGALTSIATGKVTAASTYHIDVVASGIIQGIAINGGSLNTINDSNYPDTDFIALVVDSSIGHTGSAVFSNFRYTPMP